MPRTDRAHAVVAAPVDRVFRALVSEDDLLVWLPPDGMHGRFDRFDMRPGGSYRLVLTYDDPHTVAGKTSATEDVAEVRIVDLVEGRHVVQDADFVSDDPAFAGTMRMTWSVTAVDDRTRVDLVAEDVPDGIGAEDHAAGMASSLDNLAAHVEPAAGS